MVSEFLYGPNFALDFAEIEPATFNKIVSDGFFECAQRAVAGKARPFDEDDVVAAYILGRLLDMGMGARQAGPIACMFGDGLKKMPNERTLIVGIRGGTRRLFGESDYNADKAYGTRTPRNPVFPIMAEIRFNIALIRDLIADRAAEVRPTLGE